MAKKKITGKGTNADGNDWTSYDDGSFHYNNSNGSSFAESGNHQHFTTPDGNDGWHYNSRTDSYSPGAQYRKSDKRHGK